MTGGTDWVVQYEASRSALRLGLMRSCCIREQMWPRHVFFSSTTWEQDLWPWPGGVRPACYLSRFFPDLYHLRLLGFRGGRANWVRWRLWDWVVRNLFVCWLSLAINLYCNFMYWSGQIIATSHDLTPNGGLVREIPLFQWNLGWWNIIIWPDWSDNRF